MFKLDNSYFMTSDSAKGREPLKKRQSQRQWAAKFPSLGPNIWCTITTNVNMRWVFPLIFQSTFGIVSLDPHLDRDLSPATISTSVVLTNLSQEALLTCLIFHSPSECLWNTASLLQCQNWNDLPWQLRALAQSWNCKETQNITYDYPYDYYFSK